MTDFVTSYLPKAAFVLISKTSAFSFCDAWCRLPVVTLFTASQWHFMYKKLANPCRRSSIMLWSSRGALHDTHDRSCSAKCQISTILRPIFQGASFSSWTFSISLGITDDSFPLNLSRRSFSFALTNFPRYVLAVVMMRRGEHSRQKSQERQPLNFGNPSKPTYYFPWFSPTAFALKSHHFH